MQLGLEYLLARHLERSDTVQRLVDLESFPLLNQALGSGTARQARWALTSDSLVGR